MTSVTGINFFEKVFYILHECPNALNKLEFSFFITTLKAPVWSLISDCRVRALTSRLEAELIKHIPRVPSANINAPIIMVAEKIASAVSR